MNNKVSSVQVSMMFSLICSSIYLGLGDIILIKKSSNLTLISMLIGILLGIIPILLYIKINDCYPELNFYEKTKKMFGKVLGRIINIIFFIMCFILLSIALRSIIIFTTSKYLQETPYYIIGLLLIITIFIISSKKLETITRISQILFLLTIILIIFIELFLIKYIEIDNLFPMFTGNTSYKLINGSLFFASITSINSILLLSISKNEISDKKNLSRNIILFYFISTISITIVMFFVIACFGYNIASIFRYPEYILLKKIIVSNSDLHIENFLAFRWLFYMITEANLATYAINTGLKELKLNQKKQNIILFIILLISMYLSNIVFKSINSSILVIEQYYMLFVALPIFILMVIISIKTLFIKKN